MYRMTSWLSMTIVGAFLLSGLGGVALAPAILYSALASALLANLDNLPDYGSRGLYYARPLLYVLDRGVDARTHRRPHRDYSPYVSPSVVIPSAPRVVHTEFRPASSSSFSPSPSPSHVATTFVSTKSKTPPSPILPSNPAGMAPSHLAHKPASSGATHVGRHFVPAPGASNPAPGPSSGATLVNRQFRPAH